MEGWLYGTRRMNGMSPAAFSQFVFRTGKTSCSGVALDTGTEDTLSRQWQPRSIPIHKDPAGAPCLVHPGVQDKRRVSEIDLSQPRHETAFWWRHNGPVTSQLTDPIKWPIYPLKLIGTYVHIDTNNKESLTQRCRRSTNVQLCLIFLYISIWFES